jgi:hypothetical protein
MRKVSGLTILAVLLTLGSGCTTSDLSLLANIAGIDVSGGDISSLLSEVNSLVSESEGGSGPGYSGPGWSSGPWSSPQSPWGNTGANACSQDCQ